MPPETSQTDGLASADPSELGGGTRWPTARTIAFLANLAVLAALYLYDLVVLTGYDPMFIGWWWPFEQYDVTRLDWLLALSLVFFFHWILLPLAVDRHRTKVYWDRLRGNVPAILSLGFLSVLFVLGLVGPVFFEPTANTGLSYQPPAIVGTIDAGVVPQCVGRVTGHTCHGTFHHPFGTTFVGHDVLKYALTGARVPLAIALVTATMIIPLATVVGTVSAYFGGRVDGTLMRFVDLVQTIPPLVAYIIIRFLLGGGGDIVLMLAVFGFLSWGNVARLVRSEALSRREELYVTAAEGAGASPWYVIREHLAPNVSSTVITATTLQIPTLIVTEAALSFLDLGAPQTYSWGTLIANGTTGTGWATMTEVWWVSVVPVVALSLTVVSLSVLGDALRDVLDPRIE